MVRAVLAGTKTQTRRLVKPQPTGFVGGPGVTLRDGTPAPLIPMDETVSPCGQEIRSPYGQPGDRLWVREAWRAPSEFDRVKPSDLPAPRNGLLGTPIIYEASRHESVQFGKLRPGMFMPRWACRITLEVTGVRVERLQDISEADAVAEGIERMPCRVPNTRLWRNYTPGNGWTPSVAIPQNSFRSLWESINGPGSWDLNPWVWAISFQKVTP